MKKKIFIYTIVCILILYITEQVLMFPYVLKTLIKLPLFLLIPIFVFNKRNKISFSIKLKKDDRKFIFIWSIFVFSIIILVYLILKNFIDLDIIINDFSTRLMIDSKWIVIAGLYTIVINSLIEEVFFRGFIFLGLTNNKIVAYLYSSSLFAIYHMTIFKTWFSISITILILIGLFVGGIIFAYFVDKTKSVISSWIIHLSADLAIIIIGFNILM